MEQKVSKASDHVKPCNIAQSEAHNRRDTEYIKSLDPAKLYIRTELSHRNESYVSPEMEGKTLQQYYDSIKVMVKKKTGRAMQEKDVVMKNGKTRKGASPIRESVVNIKECTTMEDLRRYVREVERRWGIHALQIHIHKDEGYFENPDDPTTWKPNYHAHIIWDWMDHSTGKSWKLNEKDMSEMQTLVAKTLGMERGTSKAETHLDHLERNDYILQKQKNEMESIAKAKSVAETQTAELKVECEHLEEEVELAKQRKEEAEKDAKAAELFKELANIAEVKLPFPKFKIDELITNAQNTINDELAIPIKLMQQKEWKQERQKNIRIALTDLQTDLGVAKGEYVEDIKVHCKEIFRYYREELKKLINENEKLQKENKTLSANNESLQKENRQLKDKISKIDANAIEHLRTEKDSQISELKARLSSETQRANTAEANLFDLRNRWNMVWSKPEMRNCWDEIVKREKEKQAEKERKEREKRERYNAILDSVIADGRKALREFALSTRSGNFNDNEAGRVYYALVALATKDNISLQTESGIRNVVRRFLDGCDWSRMTETRIMTHKAWTNDFATNEANFEQSNIDTFLSFVDEMSCSAESYVSLSGSNGCADQLTNWDGSKKLSLAAPGKKKGGGMSR